MKAFIVLTLFCLFQFSWTYSNVPFQTKSYLRPEKALIKKIEKIVLAAQDIQNPSFFSNEDSQLSQDILLTEEQVIALHTQDAQHPQVDEHNLMILFKHLLQTHKNLLKSLMIYQSEDPKEDLRLFFHGFLEQANVTDSGTIIQCYNEKTADITMQFLGAAISEVANDQWADITILIAQYNRLMPASVTNCLRKNDDLIQVYKVYGITAQKLIDIFAAISKYSLQDIQKFHQQAVNENILFQNEEYEQVGRDIGQLLLNVFHPKRN